MSVLIVGMAYKKNINDTRESPGLEILSLLLNKKIRVNYSDPYITKISLNVGKKKFTFQSLDLSATNLKKHDLTLIITAHDIFNYKKIINNSKLLVDTRFVLKKYNNRIISI